jgi:transcriptional regulator with XRE-family HTH domain
MPPGLKAPAHVVEEDKTMTMGDRLRQLRQAKGMKPIDIATVVGIPVHEYQQYESGEKKPNAVLLKKIADVLGTMVSHLRGQDTNPREAWEKENPLRQWFDSEGDPYDVTNATGIPQRQQQKLMQGLTMPTTRELAELSKLLKDPKLAERWTEWRNREPGIQTGAAP